MQQPVRVRFAPSPTGHLHIGGLRTAFFNWLFARHHKGVFLVRIEDTDKQRSKKEYVDAIHSALDWVDLHSDEPVIFQSQQDKLYHPVVDKLLADGNAYKCYCSEQDLQNRNLNQPFLKYDGFCKNKSAQESNNYVVRFKLPDIQELVFEDLVRGRVVFQKDQLDDFIIVRSDGNPMYNFVVVVDDAASKITHVIRGEDHISNTPKQILLYQACGYTVPSFAHIPLILGPSGDRLSKRDGATSALDYKKNGYLPDALLNYLVRLGWAHGDQEIFSREQLIELFTLNAVGKKGAIFDVEKLNWVNGVYIREIKPDQLCSYMQNYMGDPFSELQWDISHIAQAVELYQQRSDTLRHLIEEVILVYRGPESYNQADVAKWVTDTTVSYLQKVSEELKEQAWQKDLLSQTIKALAKELGVKMVLIAQPIRLALIGKSDGPGVFDLMLVVGKEQTLNRIEKFKEYITKI